MCDASRLSEADYLIISLNHLINLNLRLHFILKYCIVGYIIPYIYSFQVNAVAFD